jgi:hypothetical protein
MGFRVVPVGAVPTATIFASGRIATSSNWSVALEKASDTSPSPLKVESRVPSSSNRATKLSIPAGGDVSPATTILPSR